MTERIEVTPEEAQLWLDKPEAAVLIDVREPEEFAISRIEGAELIPMQSVPAEFKRLAEMVHHRAVLVLCHHGIRSLQVVFWLRAHGMENCFSVAGGIDRWSREVDPRVPRY